MDPFEGFGTDPPSLHKYLYANAAPNMWVDPSGNVSIGSLLGGLRIAVNTIGRMAGPNALRALARSGTRGMARTFHTIKEAIGVFPRKIGGGGKLQPFSKLNGQFVSWSKTLGGKLIKLGTSKGWAFATGCGVGFIEKEVSLGGATISKEQKLGYNICKNARKTLSLLLKLL